MTFPQALARLQFSEKMTRLAWQEDFNSSVELITDTAGTPYFKLTPCPRLGTQKGKNLGVVVNWTPSTADILATDWKAWRYIEEAQ